MPTARAQLEGVDMDPIDGGTLNYHVTGLSGTTTDILFQACATCPFQRDQQFAPGLKVIGGPKVIEMRGNFAALVQINIGKDDTVQPGGGGFTGTFELASGLVTEMTNLDVAGAAIRLRYDPNVAGLTPNRSTTELPGENGQVQKQVPVVVVRVSRKTDKLPIYAAYRHVGTTNAAAFLGMPPEYWLCTSLHAITDDRNRTFIESFEFSGNQFGWLQSCLYRMETGQFVNVSPDPTLAVNAPRLRFADQIKPGTTQVFPTTAGAVNYLNQVYFNGLTIVRVQGTSDFTRFNIELPQNIDEP